MKKIETTEYLRMLSRMIRAAGNRVSEADEPELVQLLELQDQFQNAVKYAVQGQNSKGRSWANIGKALGISKQGAFQKYGEIK